MFLKKHETNLFSDVRVILASRIIPFLFIKKKALNFLSAFYIKIYIGNNSFPDFSFATIAIAS